MTATKKKKLTIKRDTYLTDGKRLIRVVRIEDGEVWVEDAKEMNEFLLTHTELAAGSWRTIEVEVDDAA